VITVIEESFKSLAISCSPVFGFILP